MTSQIDFLIDDTSKWWQKEHDTTGLFIWSSKVSTMKINADKVDKVELKIDYNGIPNNEIVIIVNHLEKRYALEIGKNVISIDTDNVCTLSIKSDVFVPNTITPTSPDLRLLGVMLRGIRLFSNDIWTVCDLNDIPFIHQLSDYTKFNNEFNSCGRLIELPEKKYPVILTKPKIGILLFLHAPAPKIFESLNKYRISKHDYDVIIFSDNPAVYEFDDRILRVNNCQTTDGNPSFKKTYGAAKMFRTAIDIASERNMDYFFLLEWDCLFGKDYWFDTLVDEHNSWGPTIVSGTPIQTPTIHTSVKEGYNLHYLMQDFVSRYIIDTKLAMGSIPHPRNSLYFINGGLAFYKTEEMKEYFSDYSMKELSVGFDVHIGIKGFSKYKDKVFDKFVWLKSSYSGGNPYNIYTHEQRMNMFALKSKVAIHPYKTQ
jgi:hypothetical protein